MPETPAKYPFGPISTQGVSILPIAPNTDAAVIQLLTDIWHNQATIIKWLSKIAENTKSK